jgi:hypothetical protein
MGASQGYLFRSALRFYLIIFGFSREFYLSVAMMFILGLALP